MIENNIPYKGDALKEAQPDLDERNRLVGTILPYKASEEIVKAVEYARLLQRPLLLRGEPGCGKTKLAQAVAYELYGPAYRKYFFEWYVKSTSKATEGLYTYDHLARLRDVQAHKEKSKEQYLTYGPIGRAFLSERPPILLIDEIDKANIDFPNDLLLELDQRRFFIPELNERNMPPFEVRALFTPIVFITSNDERELPNAFLRRCIFHYIGLDEEKQKALWIDIVRSHQRNNIEEYKKRGLESLALNSELPEPIIKAVVNRFSRLVKKMRDSNADKPPDTSELLDWTRTIHYYWAQAGSDKLGDSILKVLEDDNLLIYPEVLLKTLNDYKQYITGKSKTDVG
jgi:MoxR-like ATPase